MIDKSVIQEHITDVVASLLEGEKADIGPDTVLLGSGGLLTSLLLVSLLVQVEDFCLDNGIPFVWATDSAMSEKRSYYRTVQTLTDYIASLGGEGAAACDV